MSLSVAFSFASFSSFAAPAGPAAVKSLLILPADERGRVAPAAQKLVGSRITEILAGEGECRPEPFAVSRVLIMPPGGEAVPPFSHVALIRVPDKAAFGDEDWLALGGVCRKAAEHFSAVGIAAALPDRPFGERALAQMLCGFKLRNYRFDKYQTTARAEPQQAMAVTVLLPEPAPGQKALAKADILADAVIMARDLVNEPANILGTEECVARIRQLTKLGLEVEILDQAALERSGLRALLAVAQGSARPPYLAVIRWNGGAAGQAPLAFIGKGVVFDSGGISLKPAAKMEEMKGDMAGAAAVIGAMQALAQGQAKANIIGLVGLVENMPGGKAQRPGDIITSLSGQTIEIVNTDAEGRLVLADVLWFAKERYKPCLMVDFATLTGAVLVALGSHYAGLYANNAALADRLAAAGSRTGERLWPMPLDAAYDKKLKSRFADMRNSCGREAGSITAAQFLQRFVGETAWAHIDIAGTAFGADKTACNSSWATGYGVRLIEEFVADFCAQKPE